MSEIIGKIIILGDTVTVGSAGTFRKRTLVIETDEQYKQTIPVDFVQDKCDVLNNYGIGDSVKVSINIRGNEYQGKYFCSLQGWRIEKTVIQSPTQAYEAKHKTTHVAQPITNEEDDDLPF